MKLLLSILFIFSSFQTFSQSLSVELDLSNASKTLEILKSEFPSDSSLEELVTLESSKALLKKLNTSDSTMIQAIKKSFDTNSTLTKKENSFQYKEIKETLEEISSFVNKLNSARKEIEKELQKALNPYIPKDRDITIKIVGITGGNSTGYTFGEADTFYISLHHIKNDMGYFLFICKHELFHNLQALWYDHDRIVNLLEKNQESSSDFGTYYLLLSLYSEGTATYLDDIENLKPSEANKIWIDGQAKNIGREKNIFWLFDKTIINLQNDFSNQSLNYAYGTFFLTRYDQQGYYIGGLITGYLLKKQPDKSLHYYMKQNPVEFISDYIKLSKNDEDAPYHFSKEFEIMVQNLSNKVDSIFREKN